MNVLCFLRARFVSFTFLTILRAPSRSPVGSSFIYGVNLAFKETYGSYETTACLDDHFSLYTLGNGAGPDNGNL